MNLNIQTKPNQINRISLDWFGQLDYFKVEPNQFFTLITRLTNCFYLFLIFQICTLKFLVIESFVIFFVNICLKNLSIYTIIKVYHNQALHYY